jgi:hypothetical protein
MADRKSLSNKPLVSFNLNLLPINDAALKLSTFWWRSHVQGKQQYYESFTSPITVSIPLQNIKKLLPAATSACLRLEMQAQRRRQGLGTLNYKRLCHHLKDAG